MSLVAKLLPLPNVLPELAASSKKRLFEQVGLLYENQHGMDSETFFDRYQKGLVGDEAESVEWANAYQHYVALHQQLERQLRVAA